MSELIETPAMTNLELAHPGLSWVVATSERKAVPVSKTQAGVLAGMIFGLGLVLSLSCFSLVYYIAAH